MLQQADLQALNIDPLLQFTLETDHAGIVCQGLLHYLAVMFPSQVWSSFGSWLRTIRPGIPPSELVVANALRQCMPEFLVNSAKTHFFAKFIAERQDPDTFEMFRLGT